VIYVPRYNKVRKAGREALEKKQKTMKEKETMLKKK
jgi:hypothetical protein